MTSVPTVTVRSLLRSVFWNRWSAIANGILFAVGASDLIDAHFIHKHPAFKATWVLPHFRWQTWVAVACVVGTILSLHGAYRFAADYRKRFLKLIEHKLIFELDLNHINVRVEQTQSAPRIFATIQLRFENQDIHDLSMNQLYFTLRRGSTEIFTSHAILRITSNDIQIKKEDFEGMKVQRRRLTPFYQLEVMLGIESDEIKSAADLGIADSLVLTMQSSGYQPEMAARLYPYWEAALKDGGTDQVIVTGVRAIPKDYRRLI